MKSVTQGLIRTLVWATAVLAAVAGDAAAAVRISIGCGSTASNCTLNDYLKVIATADPANHEASLQEAQTFRDDKDIKLSIGDRVEPDRKLPDLYLPVLPSTAANERLINLRPLLSSKALQDPDVQAILYAKNATSVPLQLFVNQKKRDKGGKIIESEREEVMLPFTLDLAPAYKDGSLGLILDSRDLGCILGECGLGKSLQLPIVNLSQWASGTGRQSSALVLYLNDIPMTGLTGTPGTVISENKRTTQSLRFPLQRDLANAPNQKAWHALLTAQRGTPIDLNVSLGVDASRWAYEPPAKKLQLSRFTGLEWAIGLFAAALAWLLGKRTESLRGSDLLPLTHEAYLASTPAQMTTLKNINEPVTLLTLKAPHSLSRITMAMWILIVSFSFFVMTGLTHSGDLLNTTALSLIGIGASSLVFASAIDSASEKDKELDTKLSTAINDFNSAAPPANAQARLEEGMRKARDSALITTNSFPRDIFAEKGSSRYDLHRLQMVAFTLFYMGLFLWSLNRELALPEFTTNTLALLGISTASYLGYKFTASQ